MSGETPTPGFIDFMAPRDGIMVRHAIDIVFDSDFEIIEARMFWFNTGGQTSPYPPLVAPTGDVWRVRNKLVTEYKVIVETNGQPRIVPK